MPEHWLVISFDAGQIAGADEATLDALARLQLCARRMGASIELRNATRELADLLDLVGLACEFGPRSGVEVDGHTEEREQVGIDEEVDPGDDAV